MMWHVNDRTCFNIVRKTITVCNSGDQHVNTPYRAIIVCLTNKQLKYRTGVLINSKRTTVAHTNGWAISYQIYN
jgi:hypothetical protein